MNYLVCPDGTQQPLSYTPVTIGRDRGNMIQINDDLMAGQHARIDPQGDTHIITDLNTLQGTLVNNQAVWGTRVLMPGDIISIGNSQFRVLAQQDDIGQRQVDVCPKCQTEARPGAKFCANCGTVMPVTPPTPPAQPAPPPPSYFPPAQQQSGFPAPTEKGPSPTDFTPYSPSAGGASYPPMPPPATSAAQPYAAPFSSAQTRVQFIEALKFPFADSNWAINIIIGSVLLLIPIVGLVLVGGMTVEIMRRVIKDEYDVLPPWDDWGTKFTDGLSLVGLILIWGLMLVVPFGLLGYLIMALGFEEVGLAIATIGPGLMVIVLYFFGPIFAGRYAATGDFMAALKVGDILAQVRRNFGRYFGNWLLTGFMFFAGWLLIGGAISLTALAPCLWICALPLSVAAGYYIYLFQSHLVGQLYKTLQ